MTGLPNLPASQQVSFWSFREWASPRLERVETWPMLGTPAWVLLDDHDPQQRLIKWAAALDGAQHWALHLELNQETLAEASRAVASAEDWARVGRDIHARNEFYTARPWLRRAAS